jgi:hypothetical protein
MSIIAEVFNRFTNDVDDWKKQEIEYKKYNNRFSTMSLPKIRFIVRLTTYHYVNLQVLHNDFKNSYVLLNNKKEKCKDELCFFKKYHIYRKTLVSSIQICTEWVVKLQGFLTNRLQMDEKSLEYIVAFKKNLANNAATLSSGYYEFMIEYLTYEIDLFQVRYELYPINQEQYTLHITNLHVQLENIKSTYLRLCIDDSDDSDDSDDVDEFTETTLIVNTIEYTPSIVLDENNLHLKYNVLKSTVVGCVICHDDDDDGVDYHNKYKSNCCGNIYHCKCLTNWLIRKNSCPICRVSMLL